MVPNTIRFLAAFLFLIVWASRPAEGQIVISADTATVSQVVGDTSQIALEAGFAKEFVPAVPIKMISDRLSCIQDQVPLRANKAVEGFIHFFTVRRRAYTQTMLERIPYYFPIFEAALARHGLPDELKYLSIVESGLKPSAISRSGAAGLWQFMPATGRDMRLGQNFYIDERLDPHKATEAACQYLKYLYRLFGDWELSLAAYNCGPGTVMRTLRRTGKKTFWQIYSRLPAETRSYLPQYVAVVYAMHYAGDHNIFADKDSIMSLVPHDTVRVNRFISLDSLARYIGVDIKSLRHLNPALKKNVTPDGQTYMLRLPFEKIEQFVALRASLADSALGYLQHFKDKWVQAASLQASRSGKHQKTSKLAIANKKRKQRQLQLRHTKQLLAKNKAAARKKNTYYKVQPGDTLWTIAQNKGLSVSKLQELNNLTNTRLSAGQTLIVG